MLDLERTVAPVEPVIGLAEAKAHLRIFSEDEDTLISSLCQVATERLDGADGILGRALLAQTWVLYLDRFPCDPRAMLHGAARRRHDALELPLPRLLAVESITYLDGCGERQALDPAAYQVLDGEAAMVQPARGRCWPAALCEPRSVAFTFHCGYGEDASAVPMPIVQALLMMVSDLYQNTEAQTFAPSTMAVTNPTVNALLAPYRRLRI